MKYHWSPVPYSLAKGMQFLVKGVNDAPLLDDVNTMFIQDGNALVHAKTYIPSNFQLISHRIFNNMPNTINLIFSIDMYEKGSIKDIGRGDMVSVRNWSLVVS